MFPFSVVSLYLEMIGLPIHQFNNIQMVPSRLLKWQKKFIN